jgi:predicted dehydrogenase
VQDQNLKVGLIGLGSMGRNHLRVISLLRGLELTFVADVNAELAASTGKAYGVPGVVDPTKLLKDLDAVVICTPTVTHADYIQRCANYVKNIFVEKPLTATLEDTQHIAILAKDKGLNIQVGFIERFNPAVQSLRAIIDQSEQLISLDFTRTNKISSRITDVDVITDLMIHDIDLALNINGPAQSVASHGLSRRGMISFASALITHENGRFSRILASRITDKKIRKIEGTCMDMFIDCDLLRKEIVINRGSEVGKTAHSPYTVSATQETVAIAPHEALLSELQAFAATCRKPGSVDVPGVAADMAAMRVCSQIQKIIQK